MGKYSHRQYGLAPWERRYECVGCGTRIPLCRVKKQDSLCHDCHSDAGAIDDDYDPSPWCQYCGAMEQEHCKCGPIAANH